MTIERFKMAWKYGCCLYAGWALLLCSLAQAGALAPVLHKLVRQQQAGLYKGADPYIETLITLRGDATAVRQVNGRIKFHKGDLAIAEIPLSQLPMLSRLPGVIAVEDNALAYPCLDKSATDVYAPQARQAFGMTGKNVLIGIIDSGIDWRHADFCTSDGHTRIKYILDLSLSGDFYGGKVFTEQQINNALAGGGDLGHYDYAGHGTHVAGIAAGDGSSTAALGVYCGIAPEADLIIVKASRESSGSSFSSSDQIIALTFIDSIASVRHQPYVANLSFGGHAGAHDGTSPVERYIDKLVGPNKPGKAIVTVAGNDGDKAIHALTTAAVAKMEVLVPVYTPQAGTAGAVVQIDGWYSGLKKKTISVTTPNGIVYGPKKAGEYLDDRGADGAVYIWNGFYEADNGYVSGANPFNGDREFFIQINEANTGVAPKSGVWTITLSGDATEVHAWIAHTNMDATFQAGNSNDYKIVIPGTSKNVICAAAYTTKKVWDDMDGHHLTNDSKGVITLGDIAAFSSPGPARYSSPVKPDIAAPGQIIGSSYSQNAPPGNAASIFTSGSDLYPNAFILEDRQHALSSGTSMAAPHVCGAVALTLQKYPQASAGQIRDMLAATSHRTSGQSVYRWGWGKLDIYSLLQADPEQEPTLAFSLDQAYPNPFDQRICFSFQLPIESIDRPATSIVVYNILGEKVKTLLDDTLTSGHHILYWDGQDDLGYSVASGVYLVRFVYGQNKKTLKITFLSGQN